VRSSPAWDSVPSLFCYPVLVEFLRQVQPPSKETYIAYKFLFSVSGVTFGLDQSRSPNP
jgi:hypothetical protein